jgi:ABC-type multidrug transport system fused ATPase/permease subunit
MVVVFPAATQRIIDEGIKGGRPDIILPYAFLALLGFFLQDGLNAARIFLNNHFEQKVIFDIRSDLYAHIQKLPLSWFDARATGDIMTRLIEDVTAMERVLIDGIEQGVVAILQILVVVGLMAYYDMRLAAAALLPVPFLTAGALAYTLTARARYSRQRKAASTLNALLHDNISGIRQIKTYASEERELARFNRASNDLRISTLVVMRAWALYNPSMAFLASCGALLIVAYGGWLVNTGVIEIGVLFAFLVLTRFLYEPIGRLHQLNQLVQSGRAAAERVFEIFDAKPEPGVGQGGTTKQLRGSVEFRNVSFAYREGMPTLVDISLAARPGETIALVGPTGAGKTTLVSLLLRYYEFSSGEILLDGIPLRSFDLAHLRRSIAMVTQESFLFNGTTADNLRIGKPEATEEEMWEALAAANAADFVRRLPEGLYTPVGERGVRLSVGEKQRISIARALLKNPPVLILDEATASVDTATERLIQEALDHLLANRTSFVIAHRLSTVQNANQILVLDRGRIVERGTHRELLEINGLYTRLCRSNFLLE